MYFWKVIRHFNLHSPHQWAYDVISDDVIKMEHFSKSVSPLFDLFRTFFQHVSRVYILRNGIFTPLNDPMTSSAMMSSKWFFSKTSLAIYWPFIRFVSVYSSVIRAKVVKKQHFKPFYPPLHSMTSSVMTSSNFN